jgi:DNA topoisomerase-3
MRLIIAEKPSLARAIAAALTGPAVRKDDHIACGDGDVVAWCAGHILETAAPEAYDPKFKRWTLEDLPIAPAEWKLVASAPGLLKTLKTLLKTAARVVHAGDPDREGQLLVDEVLAFLGYRGPVDRLLVSDTNPDAVRRQLAALQPNAHFAALSHSALGRQRADWLYGINMTRLYTLLGQKAGYDGVLSVGRVQTPLLGLIVRRDLAIETFRPAAYYTITATVAAAGGPAFRARWQPGDAHTPHLDEDKRLLSKPIADAIRNRTVGTTGALTEYVQEKKQQPPPLPYSLADLQIDAAKRLGLSAKTVLDACQSLYETHRLTTYPRSDCSYLPEGHHAQAPEVLAVVAARAPALAPLVSGANTALRSKAWNDKKVTAHHAIIPTANTAAMKIAPTELAVYELIARRYLLQFYPAHEFLQTKLALELGGERFTATGRQLLAPGWKAASSEPPSEEGDRAPESVDNAVLPPLRNGDRVSAQAMDVADKLTQPPKMFTDASLMQAMVHVASFVTDPQVKKILHDTDGIGTAATRPSIIETLFERGYITRASKAIVSTTTGRSFVQALPLVATTPDMTAVWEAALRAIRDGHQDLPTFLARVDTQLRQLVDQGRVLGQIAIPKHAATPASSSSRPSSSPSSRRRARPSAR